MIVFNATFLVTPGQEKHAEKILLAHVEEAKEEPGVLATRVYHSRSEPRRFFIYHELSDPAAFEAHRANRLYGGASHPEIRLVSRDRGGDSASAAATSAPQAVQCADRFHLLKNLGEALEGLLAHHLAKERTRQVQAQMAEKSQIPVWQPKRAPRYGPKLQQLQQARREEQLA